MAAGHDGVASVDKSGNTRYYEFGRYDRSPGDVKLRDGAPSLTIDSSGRLSKGSLNNLYVYLSNNYRQSKPIVAQYASDSDAGRVNAFAEGLRGNAPKWTYPGTTCKDFARCAVEAGQGKSPVFGPAPSTVMPRSMPYYPPR